MNVTRWSGTPSDLQTNDIVCMDSLYCKGGENINHQKDGIKIQIPMLIYSLQCLVYVNASINR